jgi:hypothetical protein
MVLKEMSRRQALALPAGAAGAAGVPGDTQPNPARTAAVGYEFLRDLRGRRRRRPYTPTEAAQGATT